MLRSIHAMDAIVVYDKDPDHLAFHGFHAQVLKPPDHSGRQAYVAQVTQIRQAQRDAAAYPDLGDQPSFHGMLLAHIAQTHDAGFIDKQKPLALGFYDEDDEAVEAVWCSSDKVFEVLNIFP